jgi:hypothetical protein
MRLSLHRIGCILLLQKTLGTASSRAYPAQASDWIRNHARLIRETQSIVRANLSDVHCALIQFSDPVILTDTSERVIRRGFPSRVPWWSVEIRSGPAFL